MRKLLVIGGFILIVGLIIILSIPRNPKPTPPPSEGKYKEELIRLNEQIKGYEMTITALQDSLIILDSLISNNQFKVIYIKNQANEKANRVSSYTSKQLNEFLSERYKDSIR
jgi:hypothetical protein